MDDIYKNIKECNTNKERKALIVFHDVIADILSNKKLNPTVTELFIRGRKLNVSLVFIRQSCFVVPKNTRLNTTHYFLMILEKKLEYQQTEFNHSSHIDFKDVLSIYNNVLQNHILFYLLMLLLIRWSITFQNESFRKNIKTNHENW